MKPVNEEVTRQLVAMITQEAKSPGLNKAEQAELIMACITMAMVVLNFFLVVQPHDAWVYWLEATLFRIISKIIRIFDSDFEWRKVRAKVEAMIKQKLEAHQLKVLQHLRAGQEENLHFFKNAWQSYSNATGEAKKIQGTVLLSSYNSMITVLRSNIHHCKIDDYAVAGLFEFAATANIHVILLGVGIAHGKSWGFPQEYIDNVIRVEFNRVTGLGTRVPAIPRNVTQSGNSTVVARAVRFGNSTVFPRAIGLGNNTVHSRAIETRNSKRIQRGIGEALQMRLLLDAIEKGESEGLSDTLIGSWKDAYSTMSVASRQVLSIRDGEYEDYPTYVHRIYRHGRTLVPRRKRREKLNGHKLAAELRRFADYDAILTQYALSYSEYWPYLTGEFQVPPEVFRRADREIFSGPYALGSDWVTWSKDREPPLTDRSGNLTSILVRSSVNIDGLQTRAGMFWNMHTGSTTKGIPNLIELAPGQLVHNVDLTWGNKIGTLRFDTYNSRTNDSQSYGPYGSRLHAMPPSKKKEEEKKKKNKVDHTKGSVAVNRTGYALSSIFCTKWSERSDSGCEGVAFGWRPIFLAAETYNLATT
ncbi:Delta endotoxin [Cordyceps militaris]|uniref:Delta endotoxin n=1 Tax=Cordyceps militaris TaxID=73501 RepID=A0A2H4SSJ2_CORMI|nr:Delta endotoxin [Cordyceps militaris]